MLTASQLCELNYSSTETATTALCPFSGLFSQDNLGKPVPKKIKMLLILSHVISHIFDCGADCRFDCFNEDNMLHTSDYVDDVKSTTYQPLTMNFANS